MITRIMLSMSGRFRPPQDEEEDEEAAEGEQDAEDVDTVCRSIRPTIRQGERATAARPRPAGHRPQDGDGERWGGEREKLGREDEAAAHTGGSGIEGKREIFWVLLWTPQGWWRCVCDDGVGVSRDDSVAGRHLWWEGEDREKLCGSGVVGCCSGR